MAARDGPSVLPRLHQPVAYCVVSALVVVRTTSGPFLFGPQLIPQIRPRTSTPVGKTVPKILPRREIAMVAPFARARGYRSAGRTDSSVSSRSTRAREQKDNAPVTPGAAPGVPS